MRTLVLGAVLTLATAGSVSAVTPEELAALARAGLGDDVLLALIDSTGMDRVVDASGALALKKAGVSDRVIASAIRASNQPPVTVATEPVVTDPCTTCESNIAVIGGTTETAAEPPPVYYFPWIWPATGRQHRGRPAEPYFAGDKGFGRFINDGFVDRTPPRRH